MKYKFHTIQIYDRINMVIIMKGDKNMNIVSMENISKSYGDRVLFKDANLTITDLDKIGLIGVNGTGKSTFLKIIANIESSETGNISYLKNCRIEYLSQNPKFDPEATILEQIFKGSSDAMQLLRDYEHTLDLLSTTPDNTTYQERLIQLSTHIKAKNLWDFESQVKTILTRLGIHNFDKKMGTLSGGQKKRVALASALISPSDLLILDEPTNHMDNSTIDWLEKYLETRKGALLMITHDRYFLNRVVNKTIELDCTQLYTYTGNYSEFIEKKLERQALEMTLEKKRLNLYKSELAWIRTGARARSTKQKARIQRFEVIKNSKVQINNSKINISASSSRLGKKIIEIDNISKSFGDQKIIDDFSYTLLKDDRIGIIGNNGIGKSTLLNIIVGTLSPDEGNIHIGKTVKIGYFSQESEDMNINLRAIEYIKEIAEYITTSDGTTISASQLMETFLFSKDMQWTYISRLSGGERRRLFLLRILMKEPNILILDEPTNDLDIDTLNILENYMESFNGAILSVSHDRYFLDRTCTKIFSFEGQGTIIESTGNYTDFMNKKMEEETTKHTYNKFPKPSNNAKPKINQKPKFTYKEKLEYEKIDSEIEILEDKLSQVDNNIAQVTTDFVKLQELSILKEQLEDDLLSKMERQEYFKKLEDDIKNYKS